MRFERILILAVLLLFVGIQTGCSAEVEKIETNQSTVNEPKSIESQADEAEKAYRAYDSKRALTLGLPCAKKGNAKCQYIVGEIYLIYKDNEREAIKWYEMSVAQGYARSQDKLARVILRNNPNRGFKLFQQAANQGLSQSKHYLGKLYISGKGGNKDLKKGFQLIHEIALTGNNWAQYDLGTLYNDGLGIEKDLIEAYKWYLIAQEGSTGIDDSTGQAAEDAIMGLWGKLSEEQIKEAKVRAKEFSKKKSINVSRE